MRFAYADPPYVGQAGKHYDCREVDHAELIARLGVEFEDGWALSCSSPSLQYLLPLCPQGVRVGAWVKPFASYKPGVNPAYAWEPVLFFGGRSHVRTDRTVRDWFRHNITLRRGLAGAKPLEFCHWILDMLNYQPGDSLADLFPGTGVMSIACAQRAMILRQRELFMTERAAWVR